MSIESLNYQLRKVTKNRGHFPGDDAVVKLLWLAIINIEDKRARVREESGKTQRSSRTPHRRTENHGMEGSAQRTRHRLSRAHQVNRNTAASPAPIYTPEITSSSLGANFGLDTRAMYLIRVVFAGRVP